MTAAAHALGSTTAAGPLLGLWGLGSLFGGIATTRLGGAARGPRGLAALLAMLALAHGALILTTGSVFAIAVVITLAGATIAPTVSSIYAMVDAAAPTGTRTEAYSWQLTATLVGGSLGNGVAGALAQSSGARTAFMLVAGAGALAFLFALVRSGSLTSVGEDCSSDAGTTGANPADARRPPSKAVAPPQLKATLQSQRMRRRRSRGHGAPVGFAPQRAADGRQGQS